MPTYSEFEDFEDEEKSENPEPSALSELRRQELVRQLEELHNTERRPPQRAIHCTADRQLTFPF